MRLWLIAAGISGATAVAAMAAGAHAIKLTGQQAQWFATASQLHLAHSLALLGVAILAGPSAGRLPTLAGGLFLAGIVLFCGSLYRLALAGPGSLGAWHGLPPLGGLAFIAGWLVLAIAGLNKTA